MATANITAVITAQDKGASDVLKGFGDNVNKEATKIGASIAAVGAGFMLMTKQSVDSTIELVKNTKMLQRETGATAEEASGLLYVTNRLGIGAEQVSATFGIFSKNIKQAGQETDATTTSFGKLGVNIKNADGTAKSFNEILLQTADRFKAMPDGTEKTALALELFGRSGKDLIKVLNLGSQGIREMEAQADKLGLTLNDKNIGQVSRYISAQKNLQDSTQALKVQVGLLTTPILTSFAERLNTVATRLIQTDGPLASVLAHVIALGGPIATASGGLLTFGANFAQVASGVRGLGVGLAGIVSFMTGPLGLALAATAVLGGLLTAEWLKQTTQTQALKQAQDAMKASTDALAASQVSARGATLAVEQAQRNYDEAVRQFGPDSLEARQALNNLEQAKINNTEAAKRLTQAEEELKQKEKDLAAEKALVRHLQEIQGGLEGITRSSEGAVVSISKLNAEADKTTNAVGQKIDLAPLVKGKRALGGPVTGDSPYLVGEDGPEIFTPNRSGRIIPNHKIGGGSKEAGQYNNINISVNAGYFMGSDVEARKVAKTILIHLKDLASMQQTTVSELLG